MLLLGLKIVVDGVGCGSRGNCLLFHCAQHMAALVVAVLQLLQHGVYRMHRQLIPWPRCPSSARPWSKASAAVSARCSIDRDPQVRMKVCMAGLSEQRQGQVIGCARSHPANLHHLRLMLVAAPGLWCRNCLLCCNACAGLGEGVGNIGAGRVAVLKCRAGDRHAGQSGASCLHGVLRLRAKEKPAQRVLAGLGKKCRHSEWCYAWISEKTISMY